MKHRLTLSALILGTAIFFHPRQGQCEGGGGDQKKAKKLFEEATALYNDGEYAQAVIKFHDVYDLSAQPELLYNIAVCYEKMGQTAKAAEYYGKYLDTKDKEDEESKKIKKKVAKLKSGETEEEEEEEEGEEKKGGWLKKLQMPKEEDEEEGEVERADWSHGLRFILGAHLSDEARLNYIEPGWSFRFGYNYRFYEGKASLALEAGFGTTHEDYFKSKAFYLALLSLIFGWEVLEAKQRLVQLFIGGGLEFNYFFGHRRTTNRWLLGAGPNFELQLNAGPKVGIIFGLLPMFAFTGYGEHWAIGFLVKVGIVWGIK